jgi:hypothetical protein
MKAVVMQRTMSKDLVSYFDLRVYVAKVRIRVMPLIRPVHRRTAIPESSPVQLAITLLRVEVKTSKMK